MNRRAQRRAGQNEVTVTYNNGNKFKVYKTNGTWRCPCGNTVLYKRPDYLQSHGKSCNWNAPNPPPNNVQDELNNAPDEPNNVPPNNVPDEPNNVPPNNEPPNNVPDEPNNVPPNNEPPNNVPPNNVPPNNVPPNNVPPNNVPDEPNNAMEVLQNNNIRVNNAYGLVICTMHNCIINNIKSHYHNCHKGAKNIDFSAINNAIAVVKVNCQNQSLPDNWYSLQERTPIAGLQIYNGLQCTACHAIKYCAKSKRAMKYHFQKRHEELINNLEINTVHVRVQTLQQKPFARYFTVFENADPGENQANNDPNLEQFLNRVATHSRNVGNLNPTNRKGMLAFPVISGWNMYLNIISGNNEEGFVEICKKPSANEKVLFYNVLVKLCVQFLREIRINLNFNTYNVAVALYEGIEKPNGFMPFKRTEVANTDIRYAKVLATVILFFKRVMQLPDGHALIKLKDDLHQDVKDATTSVFNAIENEEYDLDGFQMDVDDNEDIDLDPEVAEELEDVLGDDDNSDAEQDDEMDGNGFEADQGADLNVDENNGGNDGINYNNNVGNDQELAHAEGNNEDGNELDDEEVVDIDSPGRNCVYKFVRKISSQELNLWEDREKLHLFPFIVIFSMYGQKGGMNNGSTITRRLAFLEYSIRGAALLDSKGAEQAQDKKKYFERAIKRVSHMLHGNFKLIHDTKRLIKRIGADVKPLPKISFPDPMDRNVIDFNGQYQISIDDIKSAVNVMKAKLQMLYNKLFGKSFKQYINLECIRDIKTNTDEGYSFMTDVQNDCLDKIRKDSTLQIIKTLHALNDAGQADLNVAFQAKFKEITNSIIPLILGLVHFTGGLTARGTELAYTALVNNKLYFRSVHIFGSRVAILGQYNKTRSVTYSDNYILRFLPESVSQLLVVYLLRIRPLEIELSLVNGEQVEALRYQNYLFVRQGKLLTGESLYMTFRSIFNTYLTHNMGMLDFRHIIDAFVLQSESKFVLLDDLRHSQAGHSARTGNSTYARTNLDFTQLGKDKLEANRDLSLFWHERIGQYIKKEPRRDIEHEVSMKKMSIAGNIEKSKIQDEGYHFSSASPIHISTIKSGEALLKYVLHNQEVKFKSLSQQHATCLMMEGESSIIIMGTGSGKTITYLVASLHRKGRISIVIVPTICTRDQLQKIVGNIDLFKEVTIMNWEEPTQKQKILILIPHDLMSMYNMMQIQRMAVMGVLGHIVIDECQQIISWRNFMLGYQKIIDLCNLRVPIHFLSGGLPVYMEKQIRKMAGIRFTVIREKTDRKNLKLFVNPPIVTAHPNSNCFTKAKLFLIHQAYPNLEDASRCIVFIQNIQACLMLHEELLEHGVQSIVYHGELESHIKRQRQMQWMDVNKGIMIATEAFAFGVDHAKVKYVVTIGSTSSLETYVQEIGRAGRDSNVAQCYLFVNAEEIITEFNNISKEEQGTFYGFVKYAINAKVCRKSYISEHMDGLATTCLQERYFNPDYQICDVCTSNDVNIQAVTNVHSGIKWNGSACLQNKLTYYLKLKDFINTHLVMPNKQVRCVCCFLDRRYNVRQCHVSSHLLGGCKSFGSNKVYCSRCFEPNHKRSACVSIISASQICRECLLPSSIGLQQIHSGQMQNICDPLIREVLPKYILWLWKNRGLLNVLEFENVVESKDLADFVVLVTGSGMPKALEVVVNHINTYVNE